MLSLGSRLGGYRIESRAAIARYWAANSGFCVLPHLLLEFSYGLKFRNLEIYLNGGVTGSSFSAL